MLQKQPIWRTTATTVYYCGNPTQQKSVTLKRNTLHEERLKVAKTHQKINILKSVTLRRRLEQLKTFVKINDLLADIENIQKA